MTKAALQDAVAEARRFIRRAEKCKYWRQETDVESGPTAAAVKRASLDLTKALAELRRSQ